MVTIQELESEIQKIKERNKRVEADKAWEISWSRYAESLGKCNYCNSWLPFGKYDNPLFQKYLD